MELRTVDLILAWINLLFANELCIIASSLAI